MKRFNDILVVASDEETTRGVLAGAAQLARHNKASLTLLGVTEAVDRQPITLVDGSTVDVEGLLVADQKQVLERLAATVSDVPIDVATASGPRFVEIIKRVDELGHDLVITAPDAPSRRLGLAGASTTMHLLRKCPVPVWVDTPDSDLRPDVLVAVGPFEPGSAEPSLNTTLLEIGASLAARRDGTVHVAHGWRLVGETLLRRRRVGPSPDQIDELVAEAHNDAALGLRALLETVPDIEAPCELHLEKGEAATVIPELVDSVRPGVVVIGTLAHTGLRGVIMGSTAERILGTVDASVIAVKPPGFASPVLSGTS